MSMGALHGLRFITTPRALHVEGEKHERLIPLVPGSQPFFAGTLIS